MSKKTRILLRTLIQALILPGCVTVGSHFYSPPFVASLPAKPVGSMRTVDGIQIWTGGFPSRNNTITAYGADKATEPELVRLAKENRADAIVVTDKPVSRMTIAPGIIQKESIWGPYLINYKK